MSGGRIDPAHADLAAQLASELQRLQTADPFASLGLPPSAGGEQIRARFLALTKQYHPSRYARMEREIVRLANEVFLRIKEAYACLSDEANRARWLAKLAPAAPLANTSPQGSEAVPSAKPERASTERWRAPPTNPGARRAPASADAQRSKSSTGAPRTAPRPTPARVAATLRGIRPPTQRKHPPTDADELERGLRDTVSRRNEDYEMALRLLAQGRFADARTVLHKIAAEDPKTKKYRLQLHYAWGLEHEDAGNYDEARKEFERALQVDAEFKRAHEALDRLPEGKKGNGLFKRFFGR